MIDSNNMADILKNISVQDLGNGRKMVKHNVNGTYIICNSATNQVESKGVINPNPPAEYHQLEKASYQQQQNRIVVDNSFALEMYGLVNLCSGKTSTYDDIQNNMMAAYPSSSQRQYLKASEQRSNNNNRNAVELYEMIQGLFGGAGGNNING